MPDNVRSNQWIRSWQDTQNRFRNLSHILNQAKEKSATERAIDALGLRPLVDAFEINTLTEGLSAGVEVVTVKAGRLEIQLLPTRGMSIWKASYDDEEIGWKSPVRGPVHPSFVPLAEPSGLGWLDGFDELLVRCGLESNGAPEFGENGQLLYPLHGRIGNKPAADVKITVDDETGEIEISGIVYETRFHFLKARLKSTLKTKKDAAGFQIIDEVTNLSASPAEIQMLYHVNFGTPLLDGGSKVVAPIKELVPRNDHAATGIGNWDNYSAETPGFEEQVYFATLHSEDDGSTMSLLKNAHGTRGAVLKFNSKQLPCFTVWKNTTAVEDGYVTGIEPGTNYPNPRSFEGEKGRVIKLPGKGAVTLNLDFEYCASETAVDAAETVIERLQKNEPKIYDTPQADWCS